jgi:hypothetical protein
MDEPADVLIVSLETDGVAARLQRALEGKGRRVARLDGPAAARLFTVRVGPDSTSVVPSVPMFIRASAWWCNTPEESPDIRFLRAEAYATFWAAAAVSRAPVINRPGRDGPIGRMTRGAIVSALDGHPGEPAGETFASGPEVIGDGDDSVWGEDVEFLAAPIAHLRRGVPVRASKVNPAALYEVVTVVGGRAFAATEDLRTDHWELPGRSLALVRQAGVHFATVTWAVEENGATPVRLNAAPEESDLRYRWNEVAEALCEDLTP